MTRGDRLQWKELCDNIAFSYISKDKRMLIKSIYLIRDQVNQDKLNQPDKIKYYKSHWKDMCFDLAKKLEKRNKKGIKKAAEKMVIEIKKFRDDAARDPKYKKGGWGKRRLTNE
jgi:hypothetical protein